jgi:hypothetical protein
MGIKISPLGKAYSMVLHLFSMSLVMVAIELVREKGWNKPA